MAMMPGASESSEADEPAEHGHKRQKDSDGRPAHRLGSIGSRSARAWFASMLGLLRSGEIAACATRAKVITRWAA